MKKYIWIVAILSLFCGHGFCINYYVNNVTGSDSYNGLSPVVSGGIGPLATIDNAIGLAVAGDTIHLADTGVEYRQTASFTKGGSPGSPITLNGNGATLSGAEICPTNGWSTYTNDVLTRADISCNVFMMQDGEMVFARVARDALVSGEFSYEVDGLHWYLTGAPDQVEVKINGSWIELNSSLWGGSHSTISAVKRYNGTEVTQKPDAVRVNGGAELALVTAKERLDPGMWCAEGSPAALYFVPPTGTDVTEMEIECVVRQNGVGMNGTFSNVVVTNLNATHVYNDGYNIHGTVTAAEFYNCNAYECGDEGFSAHDNCSVLLDGATYEKCDNGIANVNNCASVTRNVILANSRSVGYLITSTGSSVLEDTILVDNPAQFSANNVTGSNLLIVNTTEGQNSSSAISASENTRISQVSVFGGSQMIRVVGAASSLELDDGLFWKDGGIFHIRYDDPESHITLSNVVAGSDISVEWGSTYPWTVDSVGDWFAGLSSAVDCSTDAALTGTVSNSIDIADLPNGIGCSEELISRYNQYMNPVWVPTPLSADAGPDQTVSGIVTLNAGGSVSPSDGTIVRYRWTEGVADIAFGETPIIPLSPGTHQLNLTVTGSNGSNDTDSVQITVYENEEWTFNGDLSGRTLSQAENSGAGGAFFSSGGTGDLETGGEGALLGTHDSPGTSGMWTNGALLNASLASVTTGVHYLRYDISYDLSDILNDSGTVLGMYFTDASGTNVAGIVLARSLATSDGHPDPTQPQTVIGSGLDETGTFSAILKADLDTQTMSAWYDLTGSNSFNQASPAKANVAINLSSINQLQFQATGDFRPAGSDDFASVQNIRTAVSWEEIVAPVLSKGDPVANAGSDQNGPLDTDGNGSESVTLNGSASVDPDGTVSSYIWTTNGTQIASGVSPSITLPIGTHTVTLAVTDNEGNAGTDTVSITVYADSDSDGLADVWEQEHFNSLNEEASGDADEDGINNGAEMIAGTDPNDPDSVLVLTAIHFENGKTQLSWQGGLDARQVVEKTTNLTGTVQWVPIFTNRPPMTKYSTIEDEMEETTQFFRVRAQRP